MRQPLVLRSLFPASAARSLLSGYMNSSVVTVLMNAWLKNQNVYRVGIGNAFDLVYQGPEGEEEHRYLNDPNENSRIKIDTPRPPVPVTYDVPVGDTEYTAMLHLNGWTYMAQRDGYFSGGELMFPTLRDAREDVFVVTPGAGDLVIWHTDDRAIISRVTSGVRNSLIFGIREFG